ncbi:MAG TPA: von Willebrand factor type A domain-containing protein, partial [Chitinophagaceae bacterium]|nr:von Willebrand factor type A domain-containing protein [Chitinophagaceae bacterium]
MSSTARQYYLRGEVHDEAGNSLQNVSLLNQRTGYVYKTGSSGSFGITSTVVSDTFVISLSGYKAEKRKVVAGEYASVELKRLAISASTMRVNKLQSLTKGMAREDHRRWFAGDETYASLVENRFVNTQRFPSTGISLNVDKASYSNVRRFLNLSTLVPPDAVRTEEMLNYFNLGYEEPAAGNMFAVKTQVTSSPWNNNNQLYFISLSARKLNLDTLPPSHLIFLVDVSGSMDMPNRLPLLKSGFRMLVGNLREKDSVSMVVYGGVTGIMLNTTSGAEKEKILKAIDDLEPGGSTPGESGVKLAYSVARNHFIKGGNNRVILATDGDFNVGLRSEEELEEMIARHRQTGIYLTCLGVGMGNYKDSKIQTLARKGNGNFAYIDNHSEAEKVLLTEFTQTMYAVADDAYMHVEFNPEVVKEYRLIGFDNKVGAITDTMAVVEGGEIGSGYSMTGIFEIILQKPGAVVTADKLATLHLRYKYPGDTAEQQECISSYYNFQPLEQLSQCYRFSAVVAAFGSMLKSSAYINHWQWTDLQAQAVLVADPADIRQQEFLQLVQQAKTL